MRYNTKLTNLALVAFIVLQGCATKKAKIHYEPSYESLSQYECPEWFLDAKIGFWSHWGPQSAPEQGDWYAKGMYIPKGQPGARGQYEYHVKTYGHPSEFGYKDVIKTWKAEKFTDEYADYMMDLYKKAGAKYFVTTVHHHDNFDMWDSKTHKWNSVNMGPKKDITQMFQDAAKRAGLKFGIATHLNNSEEWWKECKNADLTGPLKGVPYDGADPEYADLYHPADQTNYNWTQKWYTRVSEIVERTNPDILWFDSSPIPYDEEYGFKLVSDFYNRDIEENGSQQRVCSVKQKPGQYDVTKVAVKDYEYGVPWDKKDYPWISDSFVGHWFWNSKFENGDIPHVESSFLVHYLIDAVSKNGIVQLVIPQRSNGTVNETIIENLLKLGKWLEINGEGIYATRTYRVFGEGADIFKNDEAIKERQRERGYDYSKFGNDINYNSKHLRYTQSKDGKTIYAFQLGWPESDQVVFKSLAVDQAKKIEKVQMLGLDSVLEWEQTTEGLVVTLPQEHPCEEAYCLKIE